MSDLPCKHGNNEHTCEICYPSPYSPVMSERDIAVEIMAVAAAHMNPHQWQSFEERIIMWAEGGTPILLEDQVGRATRLINKMEDAYAKLAKGEPH